MVLRGTLAANEDARMRPRMTQSPRTETHQTPATRREALAGAAGLAAALALAPAAVLAEPAQVANEIKKLFGDKKLIPGRIKLDGGEETVGKGMAFQAEER